MDPQELTVKGIILSAAPQGEYGRRLLLLTDRLGKICVFAQAAAKPKSKLTGLTRPFTCAEFTLRKGRSAYNLHGVSLIDSFSGLFQDPEASFYGMYLLELLGFFSQEGMEDGEARQLLNLCFVSLRALIGEKPGTKREERELPETVLPRKLIRRMFELRLLVTEGEYTELPPHAVREETTCLWQHVTCAPLKQLYRFSEPVPEAVQREFCEEAGLLFSRLVHGKFKSLEVLHELG